MSALAKCFMLKFICIAKALLGKLFCMWAGLVIVIIDFLLHRYVREAGGVCIADEVQSALGRTGEKFWAFQTQGKSLCLYACLLQLNGVLSPAEGRGI